MVPPALDRAVSLDSAQPFNDDFTGRAPCNPQPASAAIDDSTPVRGQQVTVTGTPFEPREAITATLPDGRTVSTATADDAGAVTVTFRIPADLKKGANQVRLTGSSGERATRPPSRWLPSGATSAAAASTPDPPVKGVAAAD